MIARPPEPADVATVAAEFLRETSERLTRLWYMLEAIEAEADKA